MIYTAGDVTKSKGQTLPHSLHHSKSASRNLLKQTRLSAFVVTKIPLGMSFASGVSKALTLVLQVVLVGAPNVGKSSLVQVLSSGLPEVCDYPFTTKTVKMGHFYINGLKRQVWLNVLDFGF